MTRVTQLVRFATVFGVAVLSASCVKDNVVYRDAPSFTNPPAAALNFVGYSKEEQKQTVCGNCHVDQQTKWAQTKHSSAWADLQASGHATKDCEACHTVNALGNSSQADKAGWTATSDTRYHDVQCESCHGPGLDHISTPTLANRPLASIAVDTNGTLKNGCAECHNGTHNPFMEEWKSSAHGIGAELSHTSGNASCAPCHNAQGALKAWGVNTNYKELGGTELSITCAVCHDPHAPAAGKQLRFALDDPSEEGNLCMRCHHKRGAPDMTAQSRGAHSPEGPTLLGYAGWFPPGVVLPDTIIATHATDRNPRLCAGCHVNRTTVSDPSTGNFVFQGTGHGFNAIPCLDAQGKPTTGDCDISARTFKACTGSGCHGSEAAARGAFTTAELRIDELVNQLNVLIAQIPSTEFAQDSRYTTGEGAKFNVSLAKKQGSFVHNPFLIEALLTATIRQVKLDYGLTAPATVNLDNILR